MAQTSRHIVTEVHDEPHLEGRRVAVRRLRALVEGAGKSASEIADEFDLTVADVYAALEYYHTHPKKMAAVERKQREREAEVKQSGGTSVAELRQVRDEDTDDVSSADWRTYQSTISVRPPRYSAGFAYKSEIEQCQDLAPERITGVGDYCVI